MKDFIYVLYDSVACCITRIFVFKNDELAMRFLKNAIEVPNSPFALNLQDMILQRIACIDSESCIISDVQVVNVSAFDEYKKDLFNVKKGDSENGTRVKKV